MGDANNALKAVAKALGVSIHVPRMGDEQI